IPHRNSIAAESNTGIDFQWHGTARRIKPALYDFSVHQPAAAVSKQRGELALCQTIPGKRAVLSMVIHPQFDAFVAILNDNAIACFGSKYPPPVFADLNRRTQRAQVG